MEDIPFTAIGADELGEELSKTEGATTECPNCSQQHEIKWPTSQRLHINSDGSSSYWGEPEMTYSFGYVVCTNGSSYMVGLGGKRV